MRFRAPRDERTPQRVGMAWQSMWLSLLVSFALVGLLTSGQILRTVRSLPLGPVRTVTLPLARALDSAARVAQLHRPAELIESAMGNSARPGGLPAPLLDTDQGVPSLAPPPGLRRVSAQLPLQVSVISDQRSSVVGSYLDRVSGDDLPIDVTYLSAPGLGLSRPDRDNLADRIRTALRARPEALILAVGEGDVEGLTDVDGGSVAPLGTRSWEVEYGERVGGIMDMFQGENRRLIWVMLPAESGSAANRTTRVVNSAILRAAEVRRWVTVVETAALTGAADGSYSPTVRVGGSDIPCRSAGGRGYTPQCADRVGAAVAEVLGDTWALSGPAVPAPPAGSSTPGGGRPSVKPASG